MKIAQALAALAVAVGSMAGTAVLTAPAADAAPCGFYVTSDNTARYNHCGEDSITIKVRWLGMFPFERCIGPGDHALEDPNAPGDKFISNAWYVRSGC
ncbi:hypothetical protein GCM10022247_09940 [Allokutzneria multivorans]|uniref:Secreted protein n=1 Tax=Allokutzneria multivorans TaxID=1142134 RepID=A0ABP7R5S1_9PSEU